LPGTLPIITELGFCKTLKFSIFQGFTSYFKQDSLHFCRIVFYVKYINLIHKRKGRESCMKPSQLNFSDFIDDFHKYIVIEKPILLHLIQQFTDIEKLILLSWHLNYNKRVDRHHNNSLPSIVSTLILQKLFAYPRPFLLVTSLSYSLRNFVISAALNPYHIPLSTQDLNRITAMIPKTSSINWPISPNPSANKSLKHSKKS